MSVVVDSNVVAASEPLVDMAETKDVNFESPHGKEINEAAVIGEPDTNNDASNDASKGGDINGVATKGDDKVATPTDNAGAKAADEGVMDQDTSKTTPATPKKRGAKNDGDGGPPKKKRASPKSKKVKEEENHEEDGEAVEADVPETPVKKAAARGKGGKGKGKNNKTDGSAEPITPPKTPKAKGSVKVGEDSTGAVMSDDDGNGAEASITEGPAITKKGAARKRASAGKIGNNVPISTSLETASAEDKMLFKLKEEGKSWAVIREAWETMTGEKTKNSTLPNRYVRLKSNFMTLKEGDGARLLAARAEVEADIEAHVAKLRAETWSKVQKLMEDKGTTEKYPTPFLIKKYEELSAKPANDDEAKDGEKDEDSEDGKDVKMEEAGEGDGEMVGAAAEEI